MLLSGHVYITTSDIRTCAYQGVRNVRFFGKFGMICFFATSALKFALLPHYG